VAGDGQEAEATKVINIKDGTECNGRLSCWIYSVAHRKGSKGARKEELMDYFVQVIMLYNESTVEVITWKNTRLLGIALFRLLSNIQITE
jgi:hypothetical protein